MSPSPRSNVAEAIDSGTPNRMPLLGNRAVGEDELKPTIELLPTETVPFAIWFAEAFLCFLHSSSRLVGTLLRSERLAGTRRQRLASALGLPTP